MANNSYITIPVSVDPTIRKALETLARKIDEAYGVRGTTPFTHNPKQDSISKLTTSISNPPTQAEVTEIKDKVNEIITALSSANII